MRKTGLCTLHRPVLLYDAPQSAGAFFIYACTTTGRGFTESVSTTA